MPHTEKKHRIIFIDLMRAFAVFQMVQGHTIDTLLADNFRNFDNPIYALWYFTRGLTAPIFMFTAGTVFIYLFRLVNKPFSENPRVIKGIKRGLLLIFLGYLIRYPTWTIFDFSQVSDYLMGVFLGVDVLHLIGFGLLALLTLLYLSEKFNLNDYITFSIAALIIFLVSPYFFSLDWNSFLPQALAGYFYTGTGSPFPFFPWAGYVIAGGVLGAHLAKHPLVFKSSKFSVALAVMGLAFIIVSMVIDYISNLNGTERVVNSAAINLVFFRVGFVLVLNAVVSYISLKADSIPKIIMLIGRNTLLIYAVHLIALYGSAWNPGLYNWIGKTFNGVQAAISAVVMFGLMILMVLLFNKFKIKNKQLVT
ncbi:MAG: DUF1624 domain-containing protein [Bacteroidetes bacterium]|nr:DUF1624 domain-containing protein [Bacteroidota bacterium]